MGIMRKFAIFTFISGMGIGASSLILLHTNIVYRQLNWTVEKNITRRLGQQAGENLNTLQATAESIATSKFPPVDMLPYLSFIGLACAAILTAFFLAILAISARADTADH